MARVVRRRRIAASPSALWNLVSDPHHLPRWWPRTRRVENVTGGAPGERSWTQVLETNDGRGIRADYRSVAAVPSEKFAYEQTVEGTPFERFLRAARTEIRIEAQNGDAKVTLVSDQRLRGLSRLGSPMMRRAVGRTLAEALSGLERAAGRD